MGFNSAFKGLKYSKEFSEKFRNPTFPVCIGVHFRGRPRKRWVVDIEEDTQIMGIRRCRNHCKETAEWKRITEKAKTHNGL